MKVLAAALLFLSIAVTHAVAQPGKWRVTTDISPIDDSTTVTMILLANEEIPAMIGRVRPALVIRCQENRTSVIINWRRYINIDSVRVTTRLDSEPAQTRSWSMSSNHEATFAPEAVPFAKRLIRHSAMVARVTPYGANPVTVTFELAGISEGIRPLAEACNWTHPDPR